LFQAIRPNVDDRSLGFPPPTDGMVAKTRMQTHAGHFSVTVQNQNHSTVAKHFIVGKQRKQPWQEALELAVT
jgi:hypothetical protein